MTKREDNDAGRRNAPAPRPFRRRLIASQAVLFVMFSLLLWSVQARGSNGLIAAVSVAYAAFALFSLFVFVRTRRIDWDALSEASEPEARARLMQAIGGRWIITLFSVGVMGLFVAVLWLVEG